MVRINIIGGGIAGLSAATLLSDHNGFDIHLYEKNETVGGQANSELDEMCYTEYSWRIYGSVYHNINYLIHKIGVDANFTTNANPCFLQNNMIKSGDTNPSNIMFQLIKQNKWNVISRVLYQACICKDRALNEYRNTNASDFFLNNPIMTTILGPYLGLEAEKVSLSGYYKNIYSVCDSNKYNFTPDNFRITTLPTHLALFKPWLAFLKKKGVSVHTSASLDRINIEGNNVNSASINGKTIYGDEFIFACSLKPLLVVLHNSPISNTQTFSKMTQLTNGLQLYFSINIYFSKKLTGSDICSESTIIDMPWIPIIQKKRNWEHHIFKNCDNRIKDIWNIGVYDNVKGLNGKILSQCSVSEAVDETLRQIKTSIYIKRWLKEINKTWDDIFLGTEYWYEFVDNKNGTIISKNPKFSINHGIMDNMPENNPHDLPNNMYLAGYYVNNTMGGVSMEASCETGFVASDLILKKYNIKNKQIIPIKHNVEYVSKLTVPLVYFDKLLYHYKLQSLSEYLPALVLLIGYVLFILFIVFIVIYCIYKIIVQRLKFK